MSRKLERFELASIDDFDLWLGQSEEMLQRFLDAVPPTDRHLYDLTLPSLEHFEACVLTTYTTWEEFVDPADIATAIAATYYLGEVMRRYYNGRWIIELRDKSNRYYRIPCTIAKNRSQFCPAKVIRVATLKRTGNAIYQSKS